jgi:AcrR family transcriptional regulator
MARGAAKPNDETTRERVRRAALELFAEKGFNGTGIRDLAGAAGLTTSTLYHYMANKDDLLVEIMVGAIAPLAAAGERIFAEIADPAAALCTLVEHHVWLHATERLACIVSDTEVRALSGERRDQVLALRDGYEGQWRRAVNAGVEAGCFQVEMPGIAARALLQMATGVSHWFSPSGKLRLGQLCRLYSDGALGFLRARSKDGSALTRSDLELPAPDFYLR